MANYEIINVLFQRCQAVYMGIVVVAVVVLTLNKFSLMHLLVIAWKWSQTKKLHLNKKADVL
jgi:hypothetical protein